MFYATTKQFFIANVLICFILGLISAVLFEIILYPFFICAAFIIGIGSGLMYKDSISFDSDAKSVVFTPRAIVRSRYNIFIKNGNSQVRVEDILSYILEEKNTDEFPELQDAKEYVLKNKLDLKNKRNTFLFFKDICEKSVNEEEREFLRQLFVRYEDKFI